MYESGFKQILAKKSLANAYLLYGSCELSLEVLVGKIMQIYAPQKVLKMSDLDFDFATARDFLQINDLFVNSKLLVIESYKDELKKFKLKELKALANDDFRLLVIAHTAKSQKASEKVFGADFVRVFDKEQEFEQIAILLEYAAVNNVQALRNDVARLLQMCAQNVQEAGAQIRKFAGDKLDLSMCDELENLSNQFEEFFDELFKNNANFGKFSELLDGEEVIILNKLSAEFLRLFKLNAFAKEKGVMDFSVALGYAPPPRVREKMQRYASACDDKFERIFEILIFAQNSVIFEAKAAEISLLEHIVKINQILTKKDKIAACFMQNPCLEIG